MTRTMVYLPDELHRAIKHLAVERRTSMAKLVAEALEMLYKEDIEDLKTARERFKSYLKKPDAALPYSSFRSKLLKRK